MEIINEYLKNYEEKLNKLEEKYNILQQKLDKILNTAYMKDNKFPIVNALVYVPDFPLDYIQRTIVETGNFYEIADLLYLDQYLNTDSIILDVGANIGNHTIYWGKRTNVKKIYAFEPIKSTFNKLQKNIEINGLEKRTKIFNIGIGSSNSKASIDVYDPANCGGSSIQIDSNGDLEIRTIDSLNITEDYINLIKIDTEGFEYDVLKGGINTIKRYRPLIYSEIDEENKQKVFELLSDLNYKLQPQVKSTNYLFIPKEYVKR